MTDEPTLRNHLDQASVIANDLESRNEFLEIENTAIKLQIALVDKENVRLRSELERCTGQIKSLTDRALVQTRLIESLGRQIISAVPNLVSRDMPGRPLRAVS